MKVEFSYNFYSTSQAHIWSNAILLNIIIHSKKIFSYSVHKILQKIASEMFTFICESFSHYCCHKVLIIYSHCISKLLGFSNSLHVLSRLYWILNRIVLKKITILTPSKWASWDFFLDSLILLHYSWKKIFYVWQLGCLSETFLVREWKEKGVWGNCMEDHNPKSWSYGYKE